MNKARKEWVKSRCKAGNYQVDSTWVALSLVEKLALRKKRREEFIRTILKEDERQAVNR